MFLTMGISLFTSRIILKVLGIEDYGIYSIVGSVVVLFSFLNNAMSGATQRFLNFELGRGNLEEIKRVFSMSMTAHISIALIVIVLSETIGLWFLNSRLNIPLERMGAANWVYQFSIFTFCVNIIRIPYNASIIAYEEMSFYAYISIVEVVLKLGVALLLFSFGFDKLVLYAILIFIVSVTILMLYKIHCNRAFASCGYKFFWDGLLYKKIISFSGWSTITQVANIGTQQGSNILLNIYWGVAINAAMGIAMQVSNVVYGFVSNFQTAFNPQIVKLYASGESEGYIKLMFRSSKFSYYLLFLLALPILINTDFFLELWLKDVPEYSASFCRLMIVFLLIEAASAPLWMLVQATGKIKSYQLIMGSLALLNLPLAYIFLKLKFPPESVLLIRVVINFIVFFVRIVYLKFRITLSVKHFFREVVLAITLVTLLATPLPLITRYYMSNYSGLVMSSIMAIISTCFFIYMIGLKKNEQEFLVRLLLNRTGKIKTLFSGRSL